MPKYNFAVYGIRVNAAYRPDEPLTVGDLDGNGLDLLHLTHGFLLDACIPVPDDGNRFLKIEEVQPSGRSVRFSARYGTYGIAGDMVNVQTGEPTYSYGRDEAAAITLRNMIVVPPRSQTALLLVERCGGRGIASMLVKTLKAALGARVSAERLVLRVEGLTDEAAWRAYLEHAKMTEAKVVRYVMNSDIASGIAANTIGHLVFSIKPKRGIVLSGALLQAFVEKRVKAQTILGIEELDSDETHLYLEDGEQKRHVVIGRGDPPVLSYPLGDDEPPRDNEVYERMVAIANLLSQDLALELPDSWHVGQWGDEALAVKMEVPRER